MEILLSIGRFLLNLLIYVLNGFLATVYFLVDHWTLLISLFCGSVVLLVFDRLVQQIAASAPTRQGQRPPVRVSRNHQILTAVAAAIWLIAGSVFPTPVPQLGTVMWLATVAALVLLPADQYDVLWRGKMAVIAYSLVLLGFKVFAVWSLHTDPRDWAIIIGSVEEAQRVVASSRGVLLSIASYVSWFAIPAGYLVYLFQRLSVHPMSLRDPLARAGEILYLIRQRPD
jgi:hypothetical protein